MERVRKLPPREELIAFKAAHPDWTNVQIGQHFGVSHQAVRQKLRRAGQPSAREGATLLPWSVASVHANGNWMYRAILAYAKSRRGDQLTPEERTHRDQVESLAMSRDAVLTYDRDTGFYWRSRRQGDGPSVLAP